MKKKKLNKRLKVKGTKIEVEIRKVIRSFQMKYYCNYSKLEGKPDIVIPKKKVAIFVNGCFWHHHLSSYCKIARIPRKNHEYWETKFTNNRKRDFRNYTKITKKGWKVVIMWECEINSRKNTLGLYVMDKLYHLISDESDKNVYD